MEDIIFNEDDCAEHIFKELIKKGVVVSIDDIRMIMDLEYEYGESLGLYPPKDENGEREPIKNELLLTIRNVDGQTVLNSEVYPDKTLEILQEAIETVKTFL